MLYSHHINNNLQNNSIANIILCNTSEIICYAWCSSKFANNRWILAALSLYFFLGVESGASKLIWYHCKHLFIYIKCKTGLRRLYKHKTHLNGPIYRECICIVANSYSSEYSNENKLNFYQNYNNWTIKDDYKFCKILHIMQVHNIYKNPSVSISL